MSNPFKLRPMTLRAGARVWTPRAGGTIDFRGKKYVVDENGATIRVVGDDTRDARLTIYGELQRLGAGFAKTSVYAFRSGEDIFVDVGRALRGMDSQDLWAALRELPSKCGQKKVIETCRRLIKARRAAKATA